MMEENNHKRFSKTVQNYLKFRPDYPNEILEFLKKEIGFSTDFIVADIGSGTGKSSKLFLDFGNHVYAVEPNDEMRFAAENLFSSNSNFISIKGSGENSALKDKSIDLIFCGQALHWMNLEDSKIEFDRILKFDGAILIAFNNRDTEDPLQCKIDKLLRKHLPEYSAKTHKNLDNQVIQNFLKPREFVFKSLKNSQQFDLASLKGRILSASVVPQDGKIYANIMEEIENYFHEFQKNEKIDFVYKTELYLGKPNL